MGIEIPKSIIQAFEKSAEPIDNDYFIHANKAISSLNQMTEDLYCWDHMSMAINALERLYKGFLKAADIHLEWYSLPIIYDREGNQLDFLKKDHDLLRLYNEIKKNFPGVFPRTNREDWQKLKDLLRDMRTEYSEARYDDYPSFDNFREVLSFVNTQQKLLEDIVKSPAFFKLGEMEHEIDV